MYESPISITERLLDEYAKMVIERRDNAILAKVQSVVDVDIDKAELLRALKYDRGQYDKGYADGKTDAVKHGRWIDRYGGKFANKCYDCSECKGTALYKPEADELGHWRFVQALSDNCPHCGARMDGDGNV